MLINLCLKINATGNPGCTLFNSECTISAGNTLRIGAAVVWSVRCAKTAEPQVSRLRLTYTCGPDMELGHWVTGSVGHLRHLSRPGHRVIIFTRCETRVFPVFEKMPKMQNVYLKC